MDIRPIRTDEDHNAALHEIERLWGAPEGSPEGDRLDVLATLVEAYENTRWPIEPLDPVDTLKVHMEMAGLKQTALASVFGSKARASEVLNRKRGLTLDMIYKLNKEWHIPADILIQPYHVEGGSARAA